MAQLDKQLSDIQKTINSNIQTIKALLAQAQALYGIASQLNDLEGDSRQTILDEVDKMYDSINQLIEQTDTLFELYRKALNTALQNA